MVNEQPEALRLADVLDLLAMDMKTPRQAAAELRRLHAENEDYGATIDYLTRENAGQVGEIVAIKEQLVALLEAAPQPPVVEQPQIEQEPVAWQGRDGYLYHFIEEPKLGDRPLYAHPQNLNCKSTQARLATLWGYVKPQPKREPQVEQEPVAYATHDAEGSPSMLFFDRREAEVYCDDGEEPTPLYTHPQPKREPLTDEEILRVKGQFNGTLDVQFDRFARAIEAAHGIGGDA